jgi:hypothetical protein
MRALSPLPWLPAAAVVGLAMPAAAAPSAAARTSSLAWVRSEGADACIGGKELAEAVERVLGRRVFVSASAADVAIEGRVDKVAGVAGWKATLRISDDHGTLLGSRDVESPAADCREMDASLAFVIAVMIDPDATPRPPVPLDRPSPVPLPAPLPAAPPPVPPSSRWQMAPQLGVSAAFGELPTPAWGASARLRLGPPAVGVELLGSLFLPQDAAVPGTAGAAVHFTWAYAGALLCPTLARFSTLSLVGCAGALGGVLTATPSGLENEQQSASFVVLGALRARLDWHMTRAFFAVADAGVDVPFERPQWTATPPAGPAVPVFQPSAVAAETGLAIGLTLE